MKTTTILLTSLAGIQSSEAFSPLQLQNAGTTASQLAASTVPENNFYQEELELEPTVDLPKNSQSIPFLARPKHLRQELAGDVGFDPLNFSKNRDLLMEYREAEIKHSRLAMLAAVGWPVSELYDVKIAEMMNKEPILDAADRVPSLFNGGMEKVNPVWWGFCLGLTAAIDLYGVSRARTVKGYIPGDLNFDPLSLYPSEDDQEGRMKMQLAEIKHGRLAMIAVTGFSVQEFVTGIGIVDETPLFFKPLEVMEEVLEEVVNTV